MNWIDWVVIGILGISGFIAYYRGFILSLFKFTSLIIGLFLTSKLYPVVSTILRESTGIYTTMKTAIIHSLQLQNVMENANLNMETQLIQGLNLPNKIQEALIENNNSEVYQILDVEGINDYIGGYIANIGINILAMMIVLLIVMIGLKVMIGALDLIAKLPVLNSINKLAGFALGLLSGTVLIWILCIILTFYYTDPRFESVVVALQSSFLAHHFYENNVLLYMVLRLFA